MHGIHRPLDREFTYENLTVNTQAADFAAQQTAQGSANIMNNLAAAAGGGGVAGIGVGADGEPGIRPDAAKKYKKKNQDEFKGRILKFLNQFKTMKEEREMTASELASQASNDADLYRRQIQPIIKN